SKTERLRRPLRVRLARQSSTPLNSPVLSAIPRRISTWWITSCVHWPPGWEPRNERGLADSVGSNEVAIRGLPAFSATSGLPRAPCSETRSHYRRSRAGAGGDTRHLRRVIDGIPLR